MCAPVYRGTSLAKISDGAKANYYGFTLVPADVSCLTTNLSEGIGEQTLDNVTIQPRRDSVSANDMKVAVYVYNADYTVGPTLGPHPPPVQRLPRILPLS